MALFFADLVREASWGVGAGDLPLGGALPGHRRFADAAPPGARFHYCIAGVTHPDEWETGEGEIGSADTLIRLPLASSAGGDAVAFSAGLKTVALTVNADWFAMREEGGAVDPVVLAGALAAKADLAGAAFAGPVSATALALDAPLAIASGGTGVADAGAARAALGLAIGSDVQAHNARLADIAANLSATSGAIEKTGANSFGTFTVSAFGKSLIDDADAAAARATLGLGTAAAQNIGTSGANVPLLSGANSWNGLQTFGAKAEITDISGAASLTIGSGFTPARRIHARTSDGYTTLRLDGTNGGQIAFGTASGEQASLYTDADNGLHFFVNAADRAVISSTGVFSYGGIEIGYRDIPRVTGGIERGKCHATSSGVTINTGAAAGATYSIYNNSGSAITITQGVGLTLRLSGTGTSGNRTLAARGFATIWFNSASEAIVYGAGVS